MRHQLLACAAVLAAIGAQSASAQEIRLGDWQSTSHIVSVQGTQNWMKQVETKTGGKVTFSHFPAQQAAKAAGLLDAVKNGILDAALIGPIYNPETLPLNSVLGLPGFYSTASQGTAIIQKMMADGPLRKEFTDAGVVPIFSFVLPPYQVLSKGKRLTAPKDWQGLNIRTSGSTQAMVARNLGGAGVSIPGPEVYTAVERGRLDGVLFPLPSVPGYKLHEVVSHISLNGSFGGYSFVVVVRKELYENLSQASRDAMLSAGKEVAAHVAKAQDDSVAKLAKQWTAKGIEVYSFSKAQSVALNQSISKVSDEWLKRVGARHPQAAKVLARYTELTKSAQ